MVRLRELKGGQSVSAFALKCGVGESLVRKYLAGSIPSMDKAAQIARANGVTVEWLATGEGPKERSALSQLGLARDAAVKFVMKRSSVPEPVASQLMEEAFREQLDLAGLEQRHGGEYPEHRAAEPAAPYRAVNLKMLAAATAAVEERMPQVTADAKAQVVVTCYRLLAAEDTVDTAVLKDFLDGIAGLAVVEPDRQRADLTWPTVERRRKVDEK